MRNTSLSLAFVAVLAGTGAARADVWDVQTQNDNTPASENELVHGSDQLHDLGVQGGNADQDWYQLSQKPYASYEVVVDATSGDIGSGLVLNRTNADGSSVLQTSIAVGTGYSRTLRFMNTDATAVGDQRIQVTSPGCGSTCGTDDVYRLRAYETTYAVPRFNNSGTQITVLILQNPSNGPVSGRIHFWNADGTLNTTSPFDALAPKGLLVLQTQLVTPAGSTGAVTIVHDGGYGALAGKTVALEPSTGFSFDTSMLVLPH